MLYKYFFNFQNNHWFKIISIYIYRIFYLFNTDKLYNNRHLIQINQKL